MLSGNFCYAFVGERLRTLFTTCNVYKNLQVIKMGHTLECTYNRKQPLEVRVEDKDGVTH
jgi:hypothetical protein